MQKSFRLFGVSAASWGADLIGSPVLLNTDQAQGPEPETIFMATVDHWSTEAQWMTPQRINIEKSVHPSLTSGAPPEWELTKVGQFRGEIETRDSST